METGLGAGAKVTHRLRREKMKNKKHIRWCSKHQHVHGKDVDHWSCSFPNDHERNRRKKLGEKTLGALMNITDKDTPNDPTQP